MDTHCQSPAQKNLTDTLTDTEAQVILDLLTDQHANALTLSQAVERQDGIGERAYYRRKAKYPAVIAKIEAAAMERADKIREERRRAFLIQREASGIDASTLASEGLREAIDNLRRIARGEHEEALDARGRKKTLFVYARDAVQAALALQKIAAEGTWRENEEGVLQQNQAKDQLPPFVGREWTKVSAELDDGTVIEASRPEIIEGEAEEV